VWYAKKTDDSKLMEVIKTKIPALPAMPESEA
jgi:hypothetical protein